MSESYAWFGHDDGRVRKIVSSGVAMIPDPGPGWREITEREANELAAVHREKRAALLLERSQESYDRAALVFEELREIGLSEAAARFLSGLRPA